MSTVASQPLTLLRVDFPEIYARHMCRHSQFGINLTHLLALYGVWFCVYAAAFSLTGTLWVPVGMAVAYLLALVPGTPPRVLVVTALFCAVFVASVVSVPTLPAWAFWTYLLLIPIFYKVQNWTHKIWNIESDMTEFKRKYTKGRVLFVLLLFYEVPLCLNYLAFDRKRWC